MRTGPARTCMASKRAWATWSRTSGRKSCTNGEISGLFHLIGNCWEVTQHQFFQETHLWVQPYWCACETLYKIAVWGGEMEIPYFSDGLKKYFIQNINIVSCSLSASLGPQPFLCVPILQYHPVDDWRLLLLRLVYFIVIHSLYQHLSLWDA